MKIDRSIVAFFLLTPLFLGARAAKADDALRLAVLGELNAARLRAGAAALEEHPALIDVARWRASMVASSGSADTQVRTINEMTYRMRRHGYRPHNWIQSVLVGANTGALERLGVLRPEWYVEATTGDFEHVGLGLDWYGDKAVVSIVLALRKHTVEWRRAAPLADLDDVRERVLGTVNLLRQERRRTVLRGNPRLDDAAQRHAEDMLHRLFYSHVDPGGATVRDRVRAAGYNRRRTVSENIAKGLFTPEEVVHRWMNSSGHRKNILRQANREMGVGVAFDDTANGFEVIWVQVFAGGGLP